MFKTSCTNQGNVIIGQLVDNSLSYCCKNMLAIKKRKHFQNNVHRMFIHFECKNKYSVLTSGDTEFSAQIIFCREHSKAKNTTTNCNNISH